MTDDRCNRPRRRTRIAAAWVALLALLLAPFTTVATEPVARVTALRGRVGVTPPGATAPLPADNQPLAGGERIETAADTRAMLRLGSTALRLGPRADLVVRRLDEVQVLIDLEVGSIALEVATQDWADRVVVVTAEGQWRAARPGHYRLDRWPDATRATVWAGELRFDAAESTLTIPPGRRADLSLPGGPGPVQLAWGDPVPDEFAEWVLADARDAAQATALRHVSPEVVGWEDLDAHGDWLDHPEWGSVWVPRSVGAGWTPQGDGRWTWVAPWGWTWVDTSAWGFAPFHYGRWIQWQGRWGWVPGPRQGRPRYVPAPAGWTSPPSAPPPGPRPPHGAGRPGVGSVPSPTPTPGPRRGDRDAPSPERGRHPAPTPAAPPRVRPAPPAAAPPAPVTAPVPGTAPTSPDRAPAPPGRAPTLPRAPAAPGTPPPAIAAPAPPAVAAPPVTPPPRREIAPPSPAPDAGGGRGRSPAATP